MGYTPERKAAVLSRMLVPQNMALRQLSREEGIPEAMLHEWRAQARGKGQLMADAKAGPEGWISRDKFAAVLGTAAVSEADLAAYCRKRGLFAEQIKTWRMACEPANDRDRTSNARLSAATQQEKQRVKDPERELARKDKALAAAALLILRRKAAALCGVTRGPACRIGPSGGRSEARNAPSHCEGPGRRMISTPARLPANRRNAVTSIRDATAAGACRRNACAGVKISERRLAPLDCRGGGSCGSTPLDPAPRAAEQTHGCRTSGRALMSVIARSSAACRPAGSCRAWPVRGSIWPLHPASTAFCARRGTSITVAGQDRRSDASRRPAFRRPVFRQAGPCQVWTGECGAARRDRDQTVRGTVCSAEHLDAGADYWRVLPSLPDPGHLQPQKRRLGGA